jgi:hypothetical protein
MINKKYFPINPEKVNPYYKSLALFTRRFTWDLNIQSWISRNKLVELKNKYQRRKAVIVCNGPSLLKSDLSCLSSNNVFTFGLNKINLLFDKSDFRPSCIVAVNPFVIEQNSDFYSSTSIPLFLDSRAIKLIKPNKNIIFLHSSTLMEFASDCSMSVCQGSTVTFVAMQLAFHFGFQEVALIGCDHNFATKGVPHAVNIAAEKDNDHFDPNYFAGGVKWNLPDLATSEVSYSLAHQIYIASGRKLLNATEGGCLELLPRVSLEHFVLS